MKSAFAPCSNLDRLMAGLDIVRRRGAVEAGYLLVTSAPGYGKTETLLWLATQKANSVVYLRAKSGWTRHWFLSDLLTKLGHAPARHTEDLFRGALGVIEDRPGLTLIVDEVEHALVDKKIAECIRDLSDLGGISVILVGMQEVQAKISRFPQLSSRIAAVVHFQPATLQDVQTVAATLLEGVAVAEDLAAEILAHSNGLMRGVLNALARVEAEAKLQKRQQMSKADMLGKELVPDWRSSCPRVVR